MGTWEDYEAKEAELESRRARYPAACETALRAIAAAWPEHPLDASGPEWRDEDDGDSFRDGVHGKTWREIPDEFLRHHESDMTFLGPNAFREALPAWLANALGAESNVQAGLVWRSNPRNTDASFHERFDALTPAQRSAVRLVFEALTLRYAGKPSEARVQELLDMEWRA